ncbi:hypothetical protein ASE04_29630 [Rhizobium sp. Root708]|uniref:DUF1254 domain-containing protein n=1 Tax=Rhizobium sp. Root708 TaxID=1736592 RepID=UPI0006F72543|nr:DUF1254 domain-containing protein [Rhizobium sp. Root708]KRB53368.1 hypothetical protein ASE04_29630 [Rhizobium sp. Root708]
MQNMRLFAVAVATVATMSLPCAGNAETIQVPIPKTAGDVRGPVPGNTMTDEYVQLVGRMAYLWGYPLVNAHNRREAFRAAPEPGLLGGALPVAPVGFNQMLTNYIKPDQTFIVCPNQDVAYGGGFTALDKEPTVIQVPDFGKRFYVYAMYDQRTDEIGRIGQQYGTKPGFYMIVGRDWKGKVPKGITGVVRSSTDLVFIVPRVFKDSTPEDTAAVQTVINKIVMYPLSQFDGKMKIKDYSKSPDFPVPAAAPNAPKGESKWVKPETYYDELSVVVKEVPPLPGEESLYKWIASVWDAAAKSPETRKALDASFVAAEKELIEPLFQFQYNGRGIGNGWTVPANAAEWGTDYLNRTAISKSSMYQNTSAETQYNLREFDSDGNSFDGTKQYSITFPKGEVPPVKGFWSLTLYDQEKFFFANPLNRFSLGTKNKDLKYADDGSLTLYLGAKSPGAEKEANWIPAPEGHFSLILRLYWPETAVLNGKWLPPDIKQVN